MTSTRANSIDPAAESGASGPVVMCAADDAYVMPLAVTLSSTARNLSPGKRLRAFVFDAGIRDENWAYLAESLRTKAVDVIRLPANVEPLRHLKTSHHISHAAFVRLMAAEWLPADLQRVIYLDSDFLLRGDLNSIWNVDLGEAWCAAVQDAACPFVDARHADCNYRKSSPYMATIAPIRNWRQLGLDPAAPYFNSGLIIIDLARWRREQLADRFLKSLADNQRSVWCWDQYALNVVLADHWKALPLTWNQGSHVFEYPSPDYSPFDPAVFRELLEHPNAIHFTTEFKPWLYGSRHPQRSEYFAELADTVWAEWRPPRPAISLRRLSDQLGAQLVKRTTILYRKLQAAMPSDRRRFAGKHPRGPTTQAKQTAIRAK